MNESLQPQQRNSSISLKVSRMNKIHAALFERSSLLFENRQDRVTRKILHVLLNSQAAQSIRR